ncbi:MAG: DUF554 domain-containing protein [Clostridia bacterium]|nr:DUF554 domain-containing protein [Clostridia bacterium]
MLGVIINCAAVIVGVALGLILKKFISKKLGDVLTIALALCILYIGVSGALENTADFKTGEKLIVMIVATVLGAIIGTAIDIDGKIMRLGKFLERKLVKNPDGKSTLALSFVSGTLILCVGAMGVVGSLDAGIKGDNSTLIAKAIIDLVSTVVFVAAYGAGILLSTASLFIYEGSLVLLAKLISPLLSATVVTEMSAVGSLLIIMLAFNMLGITKIKIMNFIPAIFLPIGLCPLVELVLK